MSTLLKVLVPVVVGGGLIAFLASDASAATPTKDVDEKVAERIKAALATGEPAALRALAKELEDEGFKEQAASLRKAAKEIEDAMDAVEVVKPGAKPPKKRKHGKRVRVLRVQPGDGPWQVANRAGMAAAARELRDRNIPRDGKGIQRASDGKGGFKPGLNPGDLLIVPEAWGDVPGTELVTLPAGIAGDDDDDTPLRRLAGRVALEVFEARKGQENRELIETYQKAMNAAGYELPTRGLYDAKTAASLAVVHHISPPVKFGDGSPIYWPANPAPAKKEFRALLVRLAEKDPVRAEEWTQAARAVA